MVLAFPGALIGFIVVEGAAATAIAASVTTCASGAAIVGGVAGKVGEIIDSYRTLIDWKTALTDK